MSLKDIFGFLEDFFQLLSDTLITSDLPAWLAFLVIGLVLMAVGYVAYLAYTFVGAIVRAARRGG